MRPVFIFGSNPSSTAFLSALLASHSQCVQTPQFTYGYLRAARGSLFDTDPNGESFRAPLGDLEPTLERASPDAIGRLVASYASDHGRSGAEVWLEHATFRQLAPLAEAFPEALFVHLVRDGRADAAARWRVPGIHQRVAQVSRTWKGNVTQGLEAESQLGAARCLRVGYEALLGELASGLEGLASFVGVSPQSFRVPLTVSDKDYTPHLNVWRTQLTYDEVQRFEAVSGELLTHLGYGLEANGSAVPARPGAWLSAGRPPLKDPLPRSTRPVSARAGRSRP